MALTVWKTVLVMTSVQEIRVPAGADFLCAREQRGEICVWYRCDPAAPKVARLIAIVGTGRAAPGREGSRYLGTASLNDGSEIYHVFEGLE